MMTKSYLLEVYSLVDTLGATLLGDLRERLATSVPSFQKSSNLAGRIQPDERQEQLRPQI